MVFVFSKNYLETKEIIAPNEREQAKVETVSNFSLEKKKLEIIVTILITRIIYSGWSIFCFGVFRF